MTRSSFPTLNTEIDKTVMHMWHGNATILSPRVKRRHLHFKECRNSRTHLTRNISLGPLTMAEANSQTRRALPWKLVCILHLSIFTARKLQIRKTKLWQQKYRFTFQYHILKCSNTQRYFEGSLDTMVLRSSRCGWKRRSSDIGR